MFDSDEVKPGVYNSNYSALTLVLFFSPVKPLTASAKTQGSCRLGKFIVQNIATIHLNILSSQLMILFMMIVAIIFKHIRASGAFLSHLPEESMQVNLSTAPV